MEDTSPNNQYTQAQPHYLEANSSSAEETAISMKQNATAAAPASTTVAGKTVEETAPVSPVATATAVPTATATAAPPIVPSPFEQTPPLFRLDHAALQNVSTPTGSMMHLRKSSRFTELHGRNMGLLRQGGLFELCESQREEPENGEAGAATATADPKPKHTLSPETVNEAESEPSPGKTPATVKSADKSADRSNKTTTETIRTNETNDSSPTVLFFNSSRRIFTSPSINGESPGLNLMTTNGASPGLISPSNRNSNCNSPSSNRTKIIGVASTAARILGGNGGSPLGGNVGDEDESVKTVGANDIFHGILRFDLFGFEFSLLLVIVCELILDMIFNQSR